MSRVFVAIERRFGRRVVIKLLAGELAQGLSADRFRREISVAAALQQANIVPLLDAGEANGLPYYTMPFVEGESLRARLTAEPRLPASDVLRILGDVARALQYAHARGVVHRDIKPDNVLLSGGTAVVTDFGIAKAISASRTDGANGASGATLTQVGTSIGTPAYMSPEQAAGDPDVDHRADLYAFGCLAYELVTGQPPFHGRSPQRVLAAHLTEAPVPVGEVRPDLPAPLVELVMRCLAKDADDRPQSAGEVVASLNTATSGSGMPALPPVLLHGPHALRRALVVYAASVLGVAVVAQAATVVIGLPGWVLPGALVVMAFGLPLILFTGYVQRVARRALQATPAPGGTPASPGTMATIALKASPHVSWQRATRGGFYALGAFTALVVGYMVLRAFGIGPEGSLLAAGQITERDRLLLTDFGVHGTDSSTANVVVEALRVGLGQSRTMTLMSATETAAALGRMERPPTTRVDLALAQQLAQREGVKAILDGDVTMVGDGYVIALRLVAASDGAVLDRRQATVDGATGGALLAGVDQLTRELRARLGESLRSVRGSPALASVTTASLPALQLYTRAARLQELEGDDEGAIPLLREVVAMDTGFAMAWRKLGIVLGNMGRPQASVDSALTRAFQLRERLPVRERHLAEAAYYSSGPGRDRAKAVTAYRAMLQNGDSAIAGQNLASIYIGRREYAAAESLFHAQLRLRPGAATVRGSVVLALQHQGRAAESDSLLRALLVEFPNNAFARRLDESRLYRDGRYDDTERYLDSLWASDAAPSLRYFVSFGRAQMATVRGRLDDIGPRVRDLKDLSRSLGKPEQPALADSLDWLEQDARLLGEGDRVARRLDAALAAHPFTRLDEPDRPYTRVAELFAITGHPERARAVLAQRRRELTDTALVRWQAPMVHQAQGEIALAEGRPLDAITEFRRGDRRPDGPWEGGPHKMLAAIGRAYDRAGMADSTIATFERFIATPDISRLNEDQYSLAHIRRRLGELYEARGNWPKAAEHYGAFVELWKDADPELQPAVAEVRRRLARGTDVAR